MNREFMNAIDELVKEKDISKEVLLDAIEAALSSAYKKHYGSNNNVRVDINRETGDINVYMRRTVVETLDEIESETSEIHIEDAKEIDEKYEAGDIVETVVKPRDFGRIAAQTAKQVVVQKIREAERDLVYNDYINKVSEIAVGEIQRISNDTVYVNLGKTEGILAHTEQVEGEKYSVNSRIKVYIMDVRNTTKGPQIFLSRSHPGFVKRLFELEVPEIYDGIVEIKNIAREAGSRTKMAVYTANENVDAVGACVGTRGTRVQAVVDEIFGEKIDIILWDENPEVLISSALSPAKTEKVIIYEEEKMAVAVVPDHQLSLAIGKEGQNVRLAARLTGWKIDIKSHSKYEDSMNYQDNREFNGDDYENYDDYDDYQEYDDYDEYDGETGEQY
ncbi:MAG: transcription termination factor NusA [Bacillota bacterium]|nr:transcription termination factor NusA [Bacillota bacterium]